MGAQGSSGEISSYRIGHWLRAAFQPVVIRARAWQEGGRGGVVGAARHDGKGGRRGQRRRQQRRRRRRLRRIEPRVSWRRRRSRWWRRRRWRRRWRRRSRWWRRRRWRRRWRRWRRRGRCSDDVDADLLALCAMCADRARDEQRATSNGDGLVQVCGSCSTAAAERARTKPRAAGKGARSPRRGAGQLKDVVCCRVPKRHQPACRHRHLLRSLRDRIPPCRVDADVQHLASSARCCDHRRVIAERCRAASSRMEQHKSHRWQGGETGGGLVGAVRDAASAREGAARRVARAGCPLCLQHD